MLRNYKNLIISILVISIFIFTISISLTAAATSNSAMEEDTGVLDPIRGYCSNPALDSSGALKQHSVEFQNEGITKVILVLTWSDDQGDNSKADTFALSASDGVNGPSTEQSASGEITLTIEGEDLSNAWDISVECLEAGGTPLGPLEFLEDDDPGNNWLLLISYNYVQVNQERGGPGMPPHMMELYNSTIFKIHILLMISSTFLFLIVGILAGIYIYMNSGLFKRNISSFRSLSAKKPYLMAAILVFILFFIAAVPVGMYVAGKAYGWANSWSGFPAIWNPDAYSLTNADNVSLIVLVLWTIPLYFNRRDIMNTPLFRRLFGWSNWLIQKADNAPQPVLSNREFAICYFLMGIFVFVVFAVQPHG
ncbi:MAG: hypothetical protein JSV49_06215 [Thermoplasmata archaeon]|nr:MAG: hypothetical protein JSV49_06215 [Thermoplasmata archaeon]